MTPEIMTCQIEGTDYVELEIDYDPIIVLFVRTSKHDYRQAHIVLGKDDLIMTIEIKQYTSIFNWHGNMYQESMG